MHLLLLRKMKVIPGYPKSHIISTVPAVQFYFDVFPDCWFCFQFSTFQCDMSKSLRKPHVICGDILALVIYVLLFWKLYLKKVCFILVYGQPGFELQHLFDLSLLTHTVSNVGFSKMLFFISMTSLLHLPALNSCEGKKISSFVIMFLCCKLTIQTYVCFMSCLLLWQRLWITVPFIHVHLPILETKIFLTTFNLFVQSFSDRNDLIPWYV